MYLSFTYAIYSHSTIKLNIKNLQWSKEKIMINSEYTVDILINDKPVRKFPFNDKLFIEARKGQAYSIRIKNNSWNKILAATSVDGLDCITGQSATTENNNGYVINGYNSLTIDGFRISNEKVAKFVFDYKNKSYATTKEDGSEKNVGVVGVRIFNEKVKPPVTVVKEFHHYHNDYYHNGWWNPLDPYYEGLIGSSIGNGDFMKSSDMSMTYDSSNTPESIGCSNNSTSATYSSNNNIKSKGMNGTVGVSNLTRKMANSMGLCSMDCSTNEPRGFDLGTKFGESKESKVIEVKFEKGILGYSTNIYYASRQSLIEMGIPMGNEKQVSFPEPFTDKYAKPPSGWQG